MNKVEIKSIDFDNLTVIRNTYDRIDATGVNHGRAIYFDSKKNLYYKIFHKDYVRGENFEKALSIGFFEGMTPALESVIYDDNIVVGYVSMGGKILSDSEFDIDLIPDGFTEKLLDKIKETKMFFYDFVPSNIIRLDDGQLSLIDLESVYDMNDLFEIHKHNAKVKPDFLYDEIYSEWRKQMKPISFIQPSRNNLKYLKWSYNSIRKNLGYVHEICMADDFSNDGTWEWMQEISKKDPNVKIHRNEGPTRLGHTILYDTLINDYATNDIVMIYHADMYACPGLDEEINKYIEPGVVVSATRIEPPLHPPGPEKLIKDYGIEPEEFDEFDLLSKVRNYKKQYEGKTTEGIFAPWAIYKSDFQSIGGHDELFAPQSKEDSDLFNRFQLNGYKFIQTWNGFVYHMTCRGSRFADGAKRNPNGEVFMKNRETDEWLQQNERSTRNFIRKWGHMVRHNEYLKPIISPKYNIGFVVNNISQNLWELLEPWCSIIYGNWGWKSYIESEQPNTSYDLYERVKPLDSEKNNDILVEFDGVQFGTQQQFQFLQQLPQILNESGEIGEMEYDIFKITINSLETYEKDLICCNSL